ncbi:MAG TPA: M20 family metallopeptidase [Coleofasciculaceae cyanobacterium]
MLTEILALTETLTPRLIEIRRHFHAHPELSGQEQQTAAYVAGVLSSCGLRVQEGVGRTGVVGDWVGTGADDRRLAIRTDMDGLPMQEQTTVPFLSRYDGMMHACGHDLHTTVGLGVAMVLSQLSQRLPGSVRFLFQPAEEIAQGARWMVDAGAIEGVDAILGVHVYPTIPGGVVGVRYGALTAAADDLDMTIYGEAGHGARPHEAIDAIWLAAQVVTTLQQAIGRTQNPLRPVVLTIGKLQGGRVRNAIADRVDLTGTVRSLHPETRAALPQWIESIVASVCQPHGARYEVNYSHGIPSVQNDPTLMQLLESAAREAIGDANIQVLLEPSLGAEDFSVYLETIPGAMFRLGVGWPDRHNYPLHHPKFDPNEAAIPAGVATLAHAVCKYYGVG